MERHFGCTACGACCYGALPLTLDEALAHAGRFPLALVWRPVPQGVRAFPQAGRLGVVLQAGKRARLAAIVAPTAYIPPEMSCPALVADNRCGIQHDKPLRCRAMPFDPRREEADQADLLMPRKGWQCDISASAPLVYRDRKIVERTDFDREREALLVQAEIMRHYAEYMLKYMPWIAENLAAAASRPDGSVTTSLSSFLTATKRPDAKEIAAMQLPVLREFAAKTNGIAALAEFHRHYSGWAKEMEYLATA